MSKRSRANVTVGNYAQLMLALQGAGGGILEAGLGNYVTIQAQAPTNSQGATAATTVALVRTTAKASGIFFWYATANTAAVAAELVNTWSGQTQTGAGAVTTTGSGAATAGLAGPAATSISQLIDTAASGTGIAVTGGGGGALTQYTRAVTLGTAAVGDTFTAWGIAQNTVTSLVRTPFTLGNNVFLLLNYSNSDAANIAITGMSMGLIELPF